MIGTNLKLLLTITTLGVLIFGIFEMKGFLNENFVEKDTKLKAKVNSALNGQIKVKLDPIPVKD